MNLETYRNFIAIVDERSISHAASILHMAQPALSLQIKALEKEYNAKLIETGRGARQLKLTEAGWIVYKEAQKICRSDYDARKKIEEAQNGNRGTLYLSIAPSRTESFIRRYAVPFTRKYPDIKYEIRESHHLELIDQVLSGTSEAGIANAPLPDPSRFDVLFSRKEKLVLASSSQNTQLPHEKVLLPDILEKYPLVFPRTYEEIMDTYFKKNHISPKILAITGTRSMALAFARENLAWAVVTLDKTDEIFEPMEFREINDLSRSIEKTFFTLKGHPISVPLKLFLQIYEKEVQKIL